MLCPTVGRYNGGLSTLAGRPGPTSVFPLRAGKGWCYEGGIRVPLLIYFPGIDKPGVRCDQVVYSADFYPTLIELAGLYPGKQNELDGISLIPWLRNPEEPSPRSLVWHYPHYHGSAWRPGSAIREGNWKLIEFYEDENPVLYDLSVDPSEINDLSETYPEIRDSLRSRMHRKLEAWGGKYPEVLN